MNDKIRLSHGDGGVDTQRLIKGLFYKYFNDPDYNEMPDSFVFEAARGRYAYTTDSFVVKPLFFKGGDIGKLAVCGTVNDLAAAGAVPHFLSAAFIIEEDFSLEMLQLIVKSMSDTCRLANVRIVTGDTKVVEHGSIDGLFINTSGIGIVSEYYNPRKAEPGDEIIITGAIAEHGTAIMADRYGGSSFAAGTESDCAPMSSLINVLGSELSKVKLMKDPTRGGLANALNEIAISQGLDVEIRERLIPVRDEVRAICNIFGMDPLYLACEGRMLIAVKAGCGEILIKHIKKLGNCSEARIIGQFTSGEHGIAYMETLIKGRRIIPMLEGRMLPRIC